MTTASQADRDGYNGAPATFASQVDDESPSNVADGESPPDEITDFYLSAGDKIDLSDVVRYFRLSADDMRDSLYFNELERGTEVGIEFDGIPYKIVVVHGVTAADLRASDPWIFDPKDAAAIGVTRDSGVEPEMPQRAPDEFVFEEALRLPAPKQIAASAEPADVAQLAEALGLSEAQVLDALNNKGFLPDGTELSYGDSASAALTEADSLSL